MEITTLLNSTKPDALGTATIRFKLPDFPIRAVGDKVFDMPSQRVQTITRVNIFFEEDFVNEDPRDPNEDTCQLVSVYYDVTGPLDPTGDGAFPNSGRNDFEVCDPDKTLPLQY